ncbi:MAG: hypothetical protein J6S41_03530, partial [Clostridia bacterium]|nr:hypothetical protein [Clostridia bacterium]
MTGTPKRTLLEIFHKYTPDPEARKLLLSARDYRLRIDREQKLVEVRASFDAPIPKRDLYRVEEEIRLAHDVAGVRILPRYPAQCLTETYVPQLITELMRQGAVTRGFFDAYRLRSMDTAEMVIEIPFSDSGIDLVCSAKTPQILSDIIYSEFGVRLTVEVTHPDGFVNDYAAFERANAEYIAALAREAESRAAQAQAQAAQSEEEGPTLHTVNSLDRHDLIFAHPEEHLWRIGRMTFDTSEPELLFGEMFDVTAPMPIRDMLQQKRGVQALGLLSGVDSKETRNGDKIIITLFMTDEDASITLKLVLPTEDGKDLLKRLTEKKKKVKRGTADVFYYNVALAVRGNLRTDKFDGDLAMVPSEILKIGYLQRQDNAPVKRVELHCHTNMSAQDASIAPD